MAKLLLNIVSVIFIVLWTIGFFFYDIGAKVHILLLLALISVLIRIILGRNY